MPIEIDSNAFPPSPWGPVDHAVTLADGIVSISTPSHGGILLTTARSETIHQDHRRADRCYEEDVNWTIPFLVFDQDIRAADPAHHRLNIERAHAIARNWLPEFYQDITGRTLGPTDSAELRIRAAYRAAIGSHVVVARHTVRRAAGSPTTMLVGRKVRALDGRDRPIYEGDPVYALVPAERSAPTIETFEQLGLPASSNKPELDDAH